MAISQGYNTVCFKRGTTVQNNSYLGKDGEITIDTDLQELRIHDGAKTGGYPLSRLNKNKLINGIPSAAQRGTSITAAAGATTYTLDRWAAYVTGANVTVSQSSASFPSREADILQVSGASGNTAVDVFQRIEGESTAELKGQSATLGTTVYTTDGTNLTVEIRHANLLNDFSSTTLVDSKEFSTRPGTYVPISFTFTGPLSYAHYGLEVRYKFGALGAGKQVALSFAQLEKGLTSTDFEFTPAGLNLWNCYRYYQSRSNSPRYQVVSYSAAYAECESVVLFRPMRVAPVFTLGSQTFYGYTGIPGSLSNANSSIAMAHPTWNWTSATVGQAFVGYFTWTASAEL